MSELGQVVSQLKDAGSVKDPQRPTSRKGKKEKKKEISSLSDAPGHNQVIA